MNENEGSAAESTEVDQGGGGDAASPQFDWSDHIESDQLEGLAGRSVADVVKEYKNQKSLLGRQGEKLGASIQPLSEEATDEERDAFYGKLGRPEKAEDYTLQAPEGQEEEYSLFKNVGHKYGLTDSQVNGLVGEYFDGLKGLYGDPAETGLKLEEAAKEKFGDEFPKVIESFSRTLGRKFEAADVEALSTFFNRYSYTNRDDVVRIMGMVHELASATAEGAAPPKNEASVLGSASDRVAQFQRDNAKALNAGDAEAWNKLNKMVGEQFDAAQQGGS